LGGCWTDGFAAPAASEVPPTAAETPAAALTVPASTAEAMADNLVPASGAAGTAAAVDINLDAIAAASLPGVEVAGTAVTITSPGHYRLTGAWAGQVVVAAKKADVELTLDGVAIDSDGSGALVIAAADLVTVHLAAGSVNKLSDVGTASTAGDAADSASATPSADSAADTSDDGVPEGALFSRADLVIDGQGRLEVESAAGDGIVSKDGLVISSGDIAVRSGDDAVRGKDYLVIAGGTLTAVAGGDALKSTNGSDPKAGYVLVSGGVLDLTAASDGIDAETDALVAGGQLSITAGDDGVHAELGALVIDGGQIRIAESYEGLEGPVVHLAGGDIDVTASDDGVNAAGGADAAASGGTDGFNPAAPGAAPPGFGAGGWPQQDSSAAPAGFNPGQAGSAPSFDPGVAPSFDPAGRGGRQPGGWPSGAAAGEAGGFPMDGSSGFPAGGPGGGFGGEPVGNQVLLISGGVIRVDAGGDGLDSNGTLTISGGALTVFGPSPEARGGGDQAIDCGSGWTVTGGVLLGTESDSAFDGSPSENSTQPWLSVALSGAAAGMELAVRPEAETTAIVTAVLPKGATRLIVSSPDLISGQAYAVVDTAGVVIGSGTAQG
jgi:hypothetical protein